MKFFQLKIWLAAFLLAIPPLSFCVEEADSIQQKDVRSINLKKKIKNEQNSPLAKSTTKAVILSKENIALEDESDIVDETLPEDNKVIIAPENSGSKKAKPAQQTIKTAGKLVKEVYANRNMIYLNKANPYDAAFRYRTTFDETFLVYYGDNEKNYVVDFKAAVRFRYDVGTAALISTAPSSFSLAGASIGLPSSSIQKSTLWLRELFIKISLDQNPTESLYFIKFGSFPYELGRGIALGSAYNSGGFLGLDPRFSIDQFAPGALLHADIIKDTLYGELYYSLLSNNNSSYKDNAELIRINEIRKDGVGPARGTNKQTWITTGMLKWKAINHKDLKLDVTPYTYMHISPDQNLEFPADSDSQLYAIGTAIECKSGRFEWGIDTAFQGGNTRVKAWDRNYTSIVNNDGTLSVQYTKVYSDSSYTTLAIADNANQQTVKASNKNFAANGQEITYESNPPLWNAIDRFRPAQKFFYHGYFFVIDAACELIKNQLKICADAGFSSGHLDDYNDVNNMTEQQRMHQNFNGFIPVQSVYSGKRIQHLVMLNTGVPRFTVQNPTITPEQQHVQSRIFGVATLTDKFTNLAYTGLGLECTPAKFADQKGLIKPVALYYWMVDAPTLGDGSQASHALGTALSLEFTATIKDCLDMGGYVGWMIPGTQYKQFSGLQLKGGKLGSDVAYVLNFTMTYKF